MRGKPLRLLLACATVAVALGVAAAPASAGLFGLPIPWPTSSSGSSGGSFFGFWPWPDPSDPEKVAPADPGYRVVVHPDGRSRGEILAIHGGGWIGSTDYVDATRPLVNRFAGWGWRVHIVGYRSGKAGLTDLERWYRRVRGSINPRKPLCAWGTSAGAHLALLLAERADLDCVIAEAGPTYLPNTDASWDLPDWVDGMARDAFGTSLLEHSPLITNTRLKTPTVLAHAKADLIVPVGQARRYERQIANAKLIELGPGAQDFTHTEGVSGTDLDRLHSAEHALLRRTESASDGASPAAGGQSGAKALVAGKAARLDRQGRAQVKLRCVPSQRCRGRLVLRRKGRRITAKAFTIPAGKGVRVKAGLPRQSRRAIRRRGKINVTVISKLGRGGKQARKRIEIRRAKD